MSTLPLTSEELRDALPAKVKKSVNQQLIDQINNVMADPDTYEQYRENLLSYASVMQDGRFKVTNYITAVKYVSYKLQGRTNTAAYGLTFPGKIADFQARNVEPKNIASYVTAYNKSKLVSLLMEQTMTPVWVLNQDLYQSGINVLAELMLTANSEKVRSDSASALLTQLKPPETKKIEIDVGSAENETIKALRDSTMEFVIMQKQMIKSGMVNAEDVAKQPMLIDVEAEVVNP